MVIFSIVVSPSNKKALFVFVATVGLITTLRMSSPIIVTLDGTVNGNISSYSPAEICIETGPCMLESTNDKALFKVKNALLGWSPAFVSLPFLST